MIPYWQTNKSQNRNEPHSILFTWTALSDMCKEGIRE